MKTRAVRLYGVNDLRTEEFELPAINEGEILARVISDSICMSSHKAALQGAGHKRVPDDVAENPIILGHEFCGEIIEVGAKWQDQFKSGDKFSIQPAINYKGSLAGLRTLKSTLLIVDSAAIRRECSRLEVVVNRCWNSRGIIHLCTL